MGFEELSTAARGGQGWPHGLGVDRMAGARARVGVLQERDFEIAYWLSRLVAASVGQIRTRFGLGRSQTYRRLQVLCERGVVHRHHLAVGVPPLYSIYGRQLRVGTCAHAVALTQLAVAIESSGRELATEVELRRARGAQTPVGSPLSENQIETVNSCERVPDAAELLRSGGIGAYEVELSSKGRTRRMHVLRAYAGSRYEQVTWIAPDPQLAALVTREIAEVGLDSWMEVRSEIE